MLTTLCRDSHRSLLMDTKIAFPDSHADSHSGQFPSRQCSATSGLGL